MTVSEIVPVRSAPLPVLGPPRQGAADRHRGEYELPAELRPQPEVGEVDPLESVDGDLERVWLATDLDDGEADAGLFGPGWWSWLDYVSLLVSGQPRRGRRRCG